MWYGPHKRLTHSFLWKSEYRGGRHISPAPLLFQSRQEAILMGEKTKKKGSISYAKWGYIFIAPFFIIFAVSSSTLPVK